MGQGEGTLPLRKDGQIETRPMHVEEWLETLPYADFQRAGRLLHEAITASNQVSMKPGTRQALLALYDRPYRYYLQAQIRAGAQHTLTSMETMEQQLRLMKQMAGDLACAAQLVINDNKNNKSIWGSKPPLQAMQQAMAYLSQSLIFSFLEYAPTPAGVWKQLHGLYRVAENLDKLQTPLPMEGGGRTTIGRSYCRIALTEAVDPYHLPFGGIWEIYEQVDDWLAQAAPILSPFRPAANPGGLFVIDLDSDSPALPCNRFEAGTAGTGHRLLDARMLQARAKESLEQLLQNHEHPDLRLSANYRRLLLGQMARAWNLPPKRYFPRSEVSGVLPVSCGLRPTHYHMNSGRDLLQQLGGAEPAGADGLEVEDGVEARVNQTTSNYTLEQWNLLNKSRGGCALSREQRPLYTVRVGDLIGLCLAETDHGGYWRLGIIRWLMIDKGRHYHIGVQLLGRDSEPVALRLNGINREPQRAFRINHGQEISLLTARGLLKPDQTVEVHGSDGVESLQTSQLIEEMAGFEHFSVSPPH